jgi:hypothetical protein
MALEGLHSLIDSHDASNADDADGSVYYNISPFIDLIIGIQDIYIYCIQIVDSKLSF